MSLDFEKPVDYTAVDQRRRVAQAQKDGTINAFTITASPSGIHIGGNMLGEITSGAELERLAQAIGDAWSWHKKLEPKIVLSPSGH